MTVDPNPEEKPWDARLVEWMSRGSDKAGGGRDGWTPRQRAILLLVWLAYYAVWFATGGIRWWLAVGALAVAGAIELVRWRRRRS